jgi:hypothetical protein
MRTVIRIAVAVIALFVFVALLIMDTRAIVALAFSWGIGGLSNRWILLSAPLAFVVWYVYRQDGLRASGRARARATRSRRQTRASRPQKSRSQAHRQKSLATLGKR